MCGFLRIARLCISTDFAIYCDCNLILITQACFDGLFCTVCCSQGAV